MAIMRRRHLISERADAASKDCDPPNLAAHPRMWSGRPWLKTVLVMKVVKRSYPSHAQRPPWTAVRHSIESPPSPAWNSVARMRTTSRRWSAQARLHCANHRVKSA
jgi:hypothetical protein